MKALFLLALVVAAGCSSLKLHVINDSGKAIKNVEVKVAEQSTSLPSLEAGATHTQELKLTKPVYVNVYYQNETGQQYYTSSPLEVKPGDSGSLRLSVTAKGNLEAVRGK